MKMVMIHSLLEKKCLHLLMKVCTATTLPWEVVIVAALGFFVTFTATDCSCLPSVRGLLFYVSGSARFADQHAFVSVVPNPAAKAGPTRIEL